MQNSTYHIKILLLISLSSYLIADDDVIDLKTFPRPTMYTSFTKSEIIIDGIVNEEAWMKADSITDFYQSQPNPGYLPTEKTVVRILYDKDFLYVSAILYDSEPDKIIIESLEQDFDSQSSDAFAIMLDTFNDDKSGYAFLFNPAGAIKDMYIDNDGTTGDYKQGVFHRDALGLAMMQDLKIETQRDASLRADEIVATSVYGVGELNDSYGVELHSDSSIQ